MSTPRVAIAAFVKTPGLSPVKTRLTAGVGREKAETFHRLAVAAIDSTLMSLAQTGEAACYWAVAEHEGLDHAMWRSHPIVAQGGGGLDDRLHRVFSELLRDYHAVIAIGADSPQLTPADLQSAGKLLLDEAPFVLGRCPDGGFYLIGARQRLPLSSWQRVPYGESAAAESMGEELAKLGEVVELPMLTDVDRAEDLELLHKELLRFDQPTREQRELLAWIEATTAH